MRNLVAVLALLATLAAANPTANHTIGGEETSIYEAPYQVSVRKDGYHICGGSIIGANWVLTTAGHCSSYPAASYEIHSGSTDVNSGGSVHKVERVISHDKYTTYANGIPSNDIALFRVHGSFEFNDARKPVQMYQGDSASLVGRNGLVTGWGQTSPAKIPAPLHKVSVPLVARRECDRDYGRLGGVPRGGLCAGYPEGERNSCQGDLGGPLVVDGNLVGIVSWGMECGSPWYPAVYTDVGYYREWIRDKSGV